MKTYSVDHHEKGLIEYSDKKRYMWLSSLALPLLPLTGIWLFFKFNVEWVLVIPLLFNYIVFPILDFLVGSDQNNPPEEIVEQLEEDNYYRNLTIATLPLHFGVLFTIVWFVGTQNLSILAMIVMAITAGVYSGLGINTAHELGHKKTELERFLAKIVLAVPAYGHFCIEHNRGHHKDVATPEDPASSRMGEPIYGFLFREIPGAFNRGWAVEKERLGRLNKGAWNIDNNILQSFALSAVMQGAIIYLFGWMMVPFLLIHNVWAWFQLTSANYIEHYGLLRQKEASGRYETCKPYHSWNANHIMTNIILFHLQRHSDHHSNPTRRYQSLRDFENLPELPNGYYGMYVLAYFPWLWYKVMDKKLLALPHINGDLSKVNIKPSKVAAIYAKYNQAGITT